MLDQVIEFYSDVPYFHIGCDEVYYKLQHSECRNKFGGDFHRAFIEHVIKIASYVRKKIPNAKIIIWDDMLHSISEGFLQQNVIIFVKTTNSSIESIAMMIKW